MGEEQMYTVSGSIAAPARRITLTEAGFFERQHLQEWVLAHPEMLGEDVIVVTFEFDRWTTASKAATWERLDVLALDRTGRLVVAELKRDRAPDAVVVQALNYAAMASRFTLDLLAEAYSAHRGGDQSPAAILDELRDWAPALSDETLGPPRVVLVAEDFGPVLTNTAMFLIEQGLLLRLVRVQLYQLGDGAMALTASQLLPVPDAEDFMVRPRSAASTQQAGRAAAARRASIPDRLVTAGAFTTGQQLRVVVPPGVEQDREAIVHWLAEDESRGIVRWTQDPKAPVEWAVDGRPWNMTRLVTHIVEQATGEPARAQIWGPNWFQTSDGVMLHKVAQSLDDILYGKRFDWSTLHEVMAKLPAGSWTTYGDVAAVVGTAAQPLGTHIASCADCPNAQRVLGSDGRPRPNFAWTDATDTRTQQDALGAEGVEFVNGAAVHRQRLNFADLQRLVGPSSGQ